MPSVNPTIAVRLHQEMFEKIKELAERDGRSMSNFVEVQLRRLLDADHKPRFGPSELVHARKVPRQVDLAESIADAVKRGPSKAAKHK